jgi:uncharacterized RDD family membrane protein YckC
MKKNYYRVQSGEQQGPLTFDALLQTNFAQQTLIWTPGLTNWQTVNSVDDLIVKLGGNSQSTESISQLVYTNPVAALKSEALLNHYKLATRGKRLLGFFINVVFMFLVAGIVGSKTSSTIIVLLLIPLTSLLTYYLWSGNIGHKLLRMKVIDSTTAEDVKSPLFGLFRELIKGVCCSFFIPVFWLLLDKKNQNLYDKLFGTIVVMDEPLTSTNIKP